VDEDQVYRATGHLRFGDSVYRSVALRSSHGAHVTDLACGADEASATQSNPLVLVQLPSAVTADTSGSSLHNHLLDALRYIIGRADDVAVRCDSGRLPLVVNLSYGMTAGPHDGGSIIEAAIDELIALRDSPQAPFAVVLPAGNSRLTRCHANIALAAQAEQTLRWRILPDDRTPSHLEIWLPSAGRPDVAVRIGPPGGATSPWIRRGQTWAWEVAGRCLCHVAYVDARARGATRDMLLVSVAETAAPEGETHVAPMGTWEIAVRNLGDATTVDAWVQRDDTPFGYPVRGRQSRFDDAAYAYRDGAGRLVETDNSSPVRRAATLNALATGRRTLVVGGLQRDSLRPAPYSALGPALPPSARTGPDLMAPSEDSAARQGVRAAGTRSGSTAAMNGTSVAAPQVARWIAAEMAAGRSVDRQALQNFQLPPHDI
jgi:hypothetical protein